MAGADEFEKHCIQTLEIHFGQLAGGIVNKVRTKKNLDDKSDINDFKEFIDLIETNISVFAGKNNANDISNILRDKAVYFAKKRKKSEPDINLDMEKEIETFLEQNSLPTERDVEDYTKYLTLKYGGNAKNIEKQVIEKLKNKIKKTISQNKIKEEINEFLTRYQLPTKNDVDDFINYIRLSKLVFKEDELRDEIEKERLYRKFHGPLDTVITSELNELVDVLKNTNDKDDLKKKLQKHEINYLIKDESGVPDKSVSEFIRLITPTEEDTKEALEGLGLKHLISDKRNFID